MVSRAPSIRGRLMSLIIDSIISVYYGLLVFVANLRSVVILCGVVWAKFIKCRHILFKIMNWMRLLECCFRGRTTPCESRCSMAAWRARLRQFFTVHITASGQSAVNSGCFHSEKEWSQPNFYRCVCALRDDRKIVTSTLSQWWIRQAKPWFYN